MKLIRTVRKLLRGRRWKKGPTFVRAHDELYGLTHNFCEADSVVGRTRRATTLFTYIWDTSRDRVFVVRLLRWIRMMEQDHELSAAFRRNWNAMLLDLDSVALFAEAGLPGHHALVAELVGRVFQRLLPSAREESDTGRIFADVFSTPDAVERFVGQQGFVFDRLVRVLVLTPAAVLHLQEDLRQAMCLLATRVAGRGATAAVRQRGSTRHAEQSPFYRLIFATEQMMRAEGMLERGQEFGRWQGAVAACIEELDQIHLHMEDAGVSSALVYDLRSIEASLVRMDMLAAVYTGGSERVHSPLRELMNTLVRGRLEDMRLRLLVGQSVNLLARKTVERTGHGGEHYIAHSEGAVLANVAGSRGWWSADGLYGGHQDETDREPLPARGGGIPDWDGLCGELRPATDLWICAGHQAAFDDRGHAGGHHSPESWRGALEQDLGVCGGHLADPVGGGVLECDRGLCRSGGLRAAVGLDVQGALSGRGERTSCDLDAAPIYVGDCDLCRIYRGTAVAGRGDWRMVRELRRVSPGSGGGGAASPGAEVRHAEDEAGGRLAGAEPGELEYEYRAGLPAGVLARGGRGFSGYRSMFGT